jgi:hypothetical protein
VAKYIIVVYEWKPVDEGGMQQVRTYEQDQLTPEDAVMAQGEALEAIERS